MIEMVDTILGPVPRVALDVERVVVGETEFHKTLQINYRLEGQIVRQDGHVEVKKWPEGMNLLGGLATAGG